MKKWFFEKTKKIYYLEEKKKLVLLGVSLIIVLFFSFYLLNKSYAYYVTSVKLVPSVDKALYLLDVDTTGFSLNTNIHPSDEPYVYNFSVSNYKNDKRSEIDLQYTIEVRTTTNLPIYIELYKNSGTTNLIESYEYKRDEDGSWYRDYGVADNDFLYYSQNKRNIYTIKVFFPEGNLTDYYAGLIEDIEISVKSKQMVSGVGD